MPARFIRNSLIGALLLLAIAGAINYRVDPFQQYRIPTTYAPRFYYSFQRHENPGIARNYAFDRVIVSSSFMENISASEVDRAFGAGKTFNLSFSALTAYEAGQLLESVFAQGRVKEVIYNVDFNMFAGGLRRTGIPDPLPLYLYDERRWNDYPYVLSMATLRKSVNILLGRHEVGYREDADNPWYWGDTAEFSVKSVVEHLDFKDLNKRFKQPGRTLRGMLKSFEANLLPLVRAHPETRFIFVWPPYSILVWADFRQRDQLELSLDSRRAPSGSRTSTTTATCTTSRRRSPRRWCARSRQGKSFSRRRTWTSATGNCTRWGWRPTPRRSSPPLFLLHLPDDSRRSHGDQEFTRRSGEGNAFEFAAMDLFARKHRRSSPCDRFVSASDKFSETLPVGLAPEAAREETREAY